MAERRKVAVLVGGLSAEHDVSVCTGLEVLQALDTDAYEGYPVYIGLDGQWWVGEKLRDIRSYIPDSAVKRELVRVGLDIANPREGGRFVLREVGAPLWRKAKVFPVDVVFPALHGTYGEDGTLQGALAAIGVPFTGGGVGAMAVAMNKAWTSTMAEARGVKVPRGVLLARGEEVDAAAIRKVAGKFPLFVKPNFLGSSVGARVARDEAELEEAVAEVFRLDVACLVQQCVQSLVEYNVAVRREADGTVVTSAIERPIRKGDTLSFADKYEGSGADKLGNKVRAPGGTMDMKGRVLNPPELTQAQEATIRGWAVTVFEALDMAGAPRLDFMCNEKTGEIYFNEINPIPGGMSAFLWEAGSPRLSFTSLLDGLIEEATQRLRRRNRVVDPVGSGSAIFRKRG